MFKIDFSSPTTRVTLAIAASALLHALFVSSRMIELPTPDWDSASFFTATLEPITQQAAAPVETVTAAVADQTATLSAEKTKPPPTPPSESTTPATPPSEVNEESTGEQGQQQETSSENTQEGPATQDPGQAPRPLPNFTELSFNYFDGQQQLRGRALHTVKIHHQHYVLTATAEGDLDGYFKEEETSRGTFNRYGFRPGTYVNRNQTSSGQQQHNAELNWNNQALTQNGRSSSFPLETQDGLSWLYQLSQLPLHGPTLDLAITYNGQLRHYQLQVRGVELLQTAAGPLRTLQVARVSEQGDEITRVWLAVEHKLLPVRVLQTTADGTVIYDMQVQGVKISENL